MANYVLDLDNELNSPFSQIKLIIFILSGADSMPNEIMCIRKLSVITQNKQYSTDGIYKIGKDNVAMVKDCERTRIY